MADIVIKQIEEGMTGRQVADLLYSNFLALLGAIGSGGGGDIPVADIEKGVTAYGWGDHRQAGYLKGITAGMVTGALGYTPANEEGITANANAIGVLQGYFADGVAKSAAKLATSRKLWGQLFNGEADVTGALTDVTDITASGVLTIGKIKIGDGVIEWDAANGGFKVTGGLWATDYLSSKGVNTGASGGGGGGSSYQRLDTWDGYTSAKDGWVLSAKLGYGLKTTQDDILRQLADIGGQSTNVTFAPSLTSGTQIGTLTIDGEPVKMYAPSIPTTDIEKGVTAYGWGDHSKAGYLTSASSLAWDKITGTPTTLSGYGITDAYPLAGKGFLSFDGYGRPIMANNQGYAAKNNSGVVEEILWMDNTNIVYIGGTISKKVNIHDSLTINGKVAIHEGNYTDYLYSKTSIDNLLGGYLPLSGGTIDGNLSIGKTNNTTYKYIQIHRNNKVLEITNTGDYGILDFSGAAFSFNSNGAYWNSNTLIHSGNIGSQSVSYAASAGGADVIASTYANQSINMGAESRVRLISITSDNAIDLGAPKRYVSGLSVMSNYVGWQLVSGASQWNNDDFYIRKIADNEVYLDWRQIAFTDSNVASATKLQTARSIWGQSFDGTADITHGFRSMYTGSYNGEVAHSILNYYDNPYGLITRIYNDGVVSLQSQRETTNNEYFNLVLNPLGGNVGIGTPNPQYKLDVNGNFRATRLRTNNICLECGMDGSESGCSSEINNFNSALYMQLHSSLGISMCHGGGNVAVGMVSAQYKLDVNGVIHSNTGIFSDGYVSAKGQNTSSDMRLKRVLEEVTLSVDEIAAAPAFRFEWKGGAGVDVGTSAQYWEKLVPDAVKRDDAGWRMMQYGNVAMVALISLARKVKELEEQLKIKN